MGRHLRKTHQCECRFCLSPWLRNTYCNINNAYALCLCYRFGINWFCKPNWFRHVNFSMIYFFMNCSSLWFVCLTCCMRVSEWVRWKFVVSRLYRENFCKYSVFLAVCVCVCVSFGLCLRKLWRHNGGRKVFAFCDWNATIFMFKTHTHTHTVRMMISKMNLYLSLQHLFLCC